MTQHKDIQNPDDYTDKDYQKWEYLLLDSETSREELEEIVMTLAHLPTEEAQDLLKKFEQSDRSDEVSWLEPAMDEGKMWLLDPKNAREERDLKALKLYFEKQEKIVDLMIKKDEHTYRIDQINIELDALEQMAKDESDIGQQQEIEIRKSALHELTVWEKNHLEETENEMKIEDKIADTIKASITTGRYKELHPWDIEGFHFDGED